VRYFFGIYGYEITRAIQVGPFLLYPRASSSTEAQTLAADGQRFNLTAIGEIIGTYDPQALFDLSGAFTFCQQQWVEVTRPVEKPGDTTPDQMLGEIAPQLDLPHERPTVGPLLMRDSFSENSRRDFLDICLRKLSDSAFEAMTGFRGAFFRSVESWRLPRPFLDVTYYMDFSALEILARTSASDFSSRSIAEMAAPFLQKHGFDIQQDNLRSRERGVQTYAHLRNALFHKGTFVKTFPENGEMITLNLSIYESYLRRLVPDVLLRVLGYDDDHINWSRWLDRQPFQ